MVQVILHQQKGHQIAQSVSLEHLLVLDRSRAHRANLVSIKAQQVQTNAILAQVDTSLHRLVPLLVNHVHLDITVTDLDQQCVHPVIKDLSRQHLHLHHV